AGSDDAGSAAAGADAAEPEAARAGSAAFDAAGPESAPSDDAGSETAGFDFDADFDDTGSFAAADLVAEAFGERASTRQAAVARPE
ncbi:hypothetical protein PL81_22520, partial [Streptomyces sp. RSD-27]